MFCYSCWCTSRFSVSLFPQDFFNGSGAFIMGIASKPCNCNLNCKYICIIAVYSNNSLQPIYVYVQAKSFFCPVQCKFVGIPGTLTLIIPLLGPLFGGTGNEPLWSFVILGIVGCLFWSIPLVIWFLIPLLMKKQFRTPNRHLKN